VTASWRQRTFRRLDMFALRWQARLEGNAVDRSAPWIVSALLFVLLVSLALARSRSLDAGTDLALYAQSVWLIGEGFEPVSSLFGGNVLSKNVSLMLYPVATVTSVLPTVTTLLVIQSLALAMGVVPIWRIARQVTDLRFGATAAVVFAYSMFSAVHNINLADFHPEVIALPALLWAMFYGLTGRWFRFVMLVLVVMAARADLGLAIAGLGVLLVVEGRRRMGWLTAIVGLGWALVAIFSIQPDLADGTAPQVAAFSDFGTESELDVLKGFITNPFDFLGKLGSRDNFATIIALLAPVLFLPVVAPRYLLPAVPLYALYLVADVPAGDLAEAPQAIPITAFIFVATLFALKRSGTVRVERVNVDRRLLWALVFTASVFFVRDSGSSPYERPWSWGSRDATDQARHAAVELIPDDGAVRASPRLLPLLFERERLFVLDTSADEPDEQAAIDRVDWLIVDLTEAPQWTSLEVAQLDIGLGTESWLRISRSEGILVYRRCEPGNRVDDVCN